MTFRQLLSWVVAATVIGGCAGAALTPSPEAPGSSERATPTPGNPATLETLTASPPVSPDDQDFWTTTAAPVPAIDSSLPLGGYSERRGAFSIVLLGPFGRMNATGQGVCSGGWESGWPGLRGDPVSLFDELVTVRVSGIPELVRTGAAGYALVRFGQYRDPVIEDGAWVSRSRRLGLRSDEQVPAGIDETDFRRTFAGLDGTELMDTVVAWRCDPLDPSRTEPPPPTQPPPRPTPVCPVPVDFQVADIIPRLTLGRGSDQASGSTGSITFEWCGQSGGDDTPWLTPREGISVKGADPLVVRLTTEGALFDPGYGAAYGPAELTDSSFVIHPLDLQAGPDLGSLQVEAPPPGDWSISVFVGVNDTVHGVIFTSPYYFRVRVLP